MAEEIPDYMSVLETNTKLMMLEYIISSRKSLLERFINVMCNDPFVLLITYLNVSVNFNGTERDKLINMLKEIASRNVKQKNLKIIMNDIDYYSTYNKNAYMYAGYMNQVKRQKNPEVIYSYNFEWKNIYLYPSSIKINDPNTRKIFHTNKKSTYIDWEFLCTCNEFMDPIDLSADYKKKYYIANYNLDVIFRRAKELEALYGDEVDIFICYSSLYSMMRLEVDIEECSLDKFSTHFDSSDLMKLSYFCSTSQFKELLGMMTNEYDRKKINNFYRSKVFRICFENAINYNNLTICVELIQIFRSGIYLDISKMKLFKITHEFIVLLYFTDLEYLTSILLNLHNAKFDLNNALRKANIKIIERVVVAAIVKNIFNKDFLYWIAEKLVAKFVIRRRKKRFLNFITNLNALVEKKMCNIEVVKELIEYIETRFEQDQSYLYSSHDLE